MDGRKRMDTERRPKANSEGDHDQQQGDPDQVIEFGKQDRGSVGLTLERGPLVEQ